MHGKSGDKSVHLKKVWLYLHTLLEVSLYLIHSLYCVGEKDSKMNVIYLFQRMLSCALPGHIVWGISYELHVLYTCTHYHTKKKTKHLHNYTHTHRDTWIHKQPHTHNFSLWRTKLQLACAMGLDNLHWSYSIFSRRQLTTRLRASMGYDIGSLSQPLLLVVSIGVRYIHLAFHQWPHPWRYMQHAR